MSDPMTNVEIEDVLSSIRRLVSEDLRPAKMSQGASDPRTEGRLILTPAFRVTGHDEAEVAAGVPAVPHTHVPATSEPMLHVVSVSDAPVRAPLRLSSKTAWPPSPAEMLLAEAALARELADAGAAAAALRPSLPAAAPKTALADAEAELSSLETTIADLEASVSAVDDALPQSVTELDAGATERVNAAPDVLAAAVLASGAGADTPFLGRRLHFGSAGSYDAPQDGTAAEQAAWPAEAADTPENLDLDDDRSLDEAFLRDLVVEVLRQELQGPMGERITRNVRKLVRAEVHRALASREFD